MAETPSLTELTVDLLSSYLGNNSVRAEEIPGPVASTHAALKAIEEGGAPVEEEASQPVEHKGAVTARKSLASPEHIISMIDGRPYKTLKRHLSGHGLTPAEYRERYGLKADYPMVAAAYSEHRRSVAKSLGLGRKPKSAVPAEAPPAEATKRPGRKPKATEPA